MKSLKMDLVFPFIILWVNNTIVFAGLQIKKKSTMKLPFLITLNVSNWNVCKTDGRSHVDLIRMVKE